MDNVDPNFNFVIVEHSSGNTILGVRYYDAQGNPQEFAILGLFNHNLIDFIQGELESMRESFLIPRTATIH